MRGAASSRGAEGAGREVLVTVVDPVGHEPDDLLLVLEETWGKRAFAPPHDKPKDGWLVVASVLALASVACLLGGWAAGDPRLWIAAGATATVAAVGAACHRRGRAWGNRRSVT